MEPWGIPDRMQDSPTPMDEARWDELTRSAETVRATGDAALAPRRSWRRLATRGAYLVALSGISVAALHAAAAATPVHADGAADGALFSLTNQDRASNGVRSLGGNGTLGGIGEGSRYNGCGFAVYGRSVDMIQRNYFAHPILGCGQYVFSMMQAFGVHYQSAGENIGWNTYGDSGTAAAQINSAFMNSPEHRSNILNANYTALGIGSANSGSAAWSGGGGSYTGVWMFSEEFAQLAGSPPPPPPAPRPTHRPVAAPARNSPAPAAPAAPALTATTVPPPPAATPSPPAPAPATASPLPTLTLPPPLASPGGFLFNSVESVLESYLID